MTDTYDEKTDGRGAAVVAPEPSSDSPEPSRPPPATLVAAEGSTSSVILADASKKDTVDEIVDKWFSVSFPGSPVAQTTEQWNFLRSAKEELKKLLPR